MKFILASLALVAAAFALPSIASAQTASSSLLNVYVQVLNQSGYQTYVPSNFTVSVSGVSPSPSTFSGSQSGTLVSLQPGAYSVTITNTSGFSPTYSTGCNGTAAANNTQTCVVTISTNTYTYPGVQPYPYYYQQQPLSCRTETPRVGLGQTARFVAVGGVGGTYNWSTGSQTFANIGQTLTATFNSSGTHAVTVTNASQNAVCTVEVTNTYYPVQNYPGTSYYPTSGYPYTAAPVLTSVAYPRFPNTGLEPIQAVQLAFAAVFLIAAAAALYPYGRKVLATF